jgi:hypothetical protein
MEQELKEVDGVAGVASETSLSISPSPSFFLFLLFRTLDFCDPLNLSKTKKQLKISKTNPEKEEEEEKKNYSFVCYG